MPTFRLNFRRQSLLWFFQSLAVGYMLPGMLVRQRTTSLRCTQLYGSPSLLRSLPYTFRYIVVNACAFSKACARAHAQMLAPRVCTLVLFICFARNTVFAYMLVEFLTLHHDLLLYIHLSSLSISWLRFFIVVFRMFPVITTACSLTLRLRACNNFPQPPKNKT